MKRVIIATAFAAILALPASSFASGSSRGGTASAQRNPQTITETMTCKIIGVTANGVVTVEDADGAKRRFSITEDISIKNKDKGSFDGRKKLEASDLSEGLMIKVVHRPSSGEVVKITVIEKA